MAQQQVCQTLLRPHFIFISPLGANDFHMIGINNVVHCLTTTWTILSTHITLVHVS